MITIQGCHRYFDTMQKITPVAGVFVVYIPFVVGASQIARLGHLAKIVPALQGVAEDEAMCSAWNGIVGSLALTVFISFLPNILVGIYNNVFKLKAYNSSAWADRMSF